MKRLLMISLLFICCKGNSSHFTSVDNVNYTLPLEFVEQDSLLVGIQDKIYLAFVQSTMSSNNSNILSLRTELEELYKEKELALIVYWRSYLQFYSSIFYLKTNNKSAAEKEIDKGIQLLKKIEKKNSEDYALLAMLQSFSIQFKGFKVVFLSNEIKKHAKHAIALDSTNLRAYYVYASNDFYKPEKYGGGKEVEQNLLKALGLPSQQVVNNYLPSWGKEESYEMLIKFYMRMEKWDKAKFYFQEAKKSYPDSYSINQLAAKLLDK